MALKVQDKGEDSIKEELFNKLGSIKEDNNKLKQELIKMMKILTKIINI